MATTSFVDVREREKGFEGREIVVGVWEGDWVWWMWRVESQEAEMRRAWAGL